MQFQVPQFIETEDKLLGPFTVKQFIYVGLASGLSFMLFFLVQTSVWLVITIVLGTAVLVLTLGKVNGQPMTKIAASAFFYYWKPQTYVWQPDTPGLQKGEAAQQSGFSLDRIVAGLALRDAWQTVQTGSKGFGDKTISSVKQVEERYEIFHQSGGDQRAARRIDYR